MHYWGGISFMLKTEAFYFSLEYIFQLKVSQKN